MPRPASESPSSVLAAAITAGGQSRRFGQDKALYELDGVPLLNRVADSLQHASPRLLIAPAGRYRLDGWQTVPDLRPGQGPLAGLETALTALLVQQPAGGWLAFAAVDLPYLTPGYWHLLAGHITEQVQSVTGLDGSGLEGTGLNGTRLESTGRRQSLAALYHTTALAQVVALLDSGERRMKALLERLDSADVGWQTVSARYPQVYLNLNAPPDSSVPDLPS